MAQEGSSFAISINYFPASSYQNECNSATPRSNPLCTGARRKLGSAPCPIAPGQIFVMMGFIGSDHASEERGEKDCKSELSHQECLQNLAMEPRAHRLSQASLENASWEEVNAASGFQRHRF